MGDELLNGIVKDIVKMSAPQQCSKCGNSLHYEGVGEYLCIKCGNIEYDDYGKVRNYLETHGLANQAEVSEATGVPMKVIRQLVLEGRLGIENKQ